MTTITAALLHLSPLLAFIASLHLMSCNGYTPGYDQHFCDFENGLCDWKSIYTPANWTLHTGPSPSNCSGPQYVDANGSPGGTYVVFDPSARPNDPLWDGMLLDTLFMPVGKICQAKVKYYMSGSDVGSLSLAQLRVTDQDIHSRHVLAKVQGHQGDQWKTLRSAQYVIHQKFRVVVAFRHSGTGPCGVIAIDAPVVTKHCLKAITTAARREFAAGSCSFQIDTCGWYDSDSPSFDWTRWFGTTPSSQTGPEKDYDLQEAEGYYIYYEATEANNERTTLSSPMFNRSSFMCTFSFAYHMYGLDIGYLNVALYSVGSQQRTVLWTRSGVQGNAWHRVHVVVGSNNEWFQMELSTAALGLKGDVALDGLTFTNCNPDEIVPDWQCDFSHGPCTLHTAVADPAKSTWHSVTANTSADLNCSLPLTDHSNNSNGRYLAAIDLSSGSSSSLYTEEKGGCSFNCFLGFSYFIGGTQSVTIDITARGVTSSRLYSIWNDVLAETSKWETEYRQVGPINERFVLNMAIQMEKNDSSCTFFALDDVQFFNSAGGLASETVPVTGAAIPKGSCDFEEGHTCLLFFNSPNRDDGDWIVGDGWAPSAVSGPITDATLKSESGHYLYSQAIDSSSSSLSKLQTAWYDTSSFTCFLSFAYNLHGPYVGEIAVFIETFTARLNAWSEKGNKGIAWQTTEIYLGHFTSQFRISILAIHDSRSDDILALDDITFNDCNYDNECDWESENGCLWWRTVNVSAESGSWERLLAADAQFGEADAALNATSVHIALNETSGYVAYFNSSDAVAVLESVPFSPTNASSNCRISFSYYMHGNSSGTLTVSQKTKRVEVIHPVSWSGNQGDLWHTVDIVLAPIVDEFSIQITAKGTGVNEHDAAMALDDLHLLDCKPVLKCSYATADRSNTIEDIISECWSLYDSSSSVTAPPISPAVTTTACTMATSINTNIPKSTSTPTSAVVTTITSTTTSTVVPSIPTITSTPTSAVVTSIPTITSTPTSTDVTSIPTITSTPTSAVVTSIPTITSTPTSIVVPSIPTITSTPTSAVVTSIPTITSTPTSAVVTSIPTITSTPTSIVVPSIPTITSTPTSAVVTSIPTIASTPASTVMTRTSSTEQWRSTSNVWSTTGALVPSSAVVVAVPVDEKCNCAQELKQRDIVANATNAMSSVLFVMLVILIVLFLMESRKSLPDKTVQEVTVKDDPSAVSDATQSGVPSSSHADTQKSKSLARAGVASDIPSQIKTDTSTDRRVVRDRRASVEQLLNVADFEMYFDRLEMGRCYRLSSSHADGQESNDPSSAHLPVASNTTSQVKTAASTDREGVGDQREQVLKEPDFELYYDRLELGRAYRLPSADGSTGITTASLQSIGNDSETRVKSEASSGHQALVSRSAQSELATSDSQQAKSLRDNEDRLTSRRVAYRGDTDAADNPLFKPPTRPVEAQYQSTQNIEESPESLPVVKQHFRQPTFQDRSDAKIRPVSENENEPQGSTSSNARRSAMEERVPHERQQRQPAHALERDNEASDVPAVKGHTVQEVEDMSNSTRSPPFKRRPVLAHPPVTSRPDFSPLVNDGNDTAAVSPAGDATSAMTSSRLYPSSFPTRRGPSSDRGLRETRGDRVASRRPLRASREQRPRQRLPSSHRRSVFREQMISPAQLRAVGHAGDYMEAADMTARLLAEAVGAGGNWENTQ